LHSLHNGVEAEAHAAAAAACCRGPSRAKGLNYAAQGPCTCCSVPSCQRRAPAQPGQAVCRRVLDLVRSWRRGVWLLSGRERASMVQ
jgi:hypothetical protein